MKPWNATFRPFADYRARKPAGLKEVMDFARGLEDLAHAVVEPWAVLPLEDERTPPTLEQARDTVRVAIGENGPWPRAWMCAPLRLPPLAELVPPAQWGSWQVQFDSDGLGDIYADGVLIRERLFLHGTTELVPARDPAHRPWVVYSLDTTVQKVKLEMARSSLSGLAEINALVRDVARSLRTAASLLSTENPRHNLFVSGEVKINRSPLPDEERAGLTRQLLEAAAQVDVDAYCSGNLQGFLASLERCREALAPLAVFAKRFSLFLFGVSHIDLAWRWRWPETIECMRGTLANQVEFMKQHPGFNFMESSPPVWYALRDRDPELYQALRRFGRERQFEPAGGMWCETDGHLLSGESWVRQTLFGQKAALDVCVRQARAGHNTDGFGFTRALPKILAQAEMDAFLTQKLRYNEFTLFEDVLFWWESDDGTRVMGFHAYPDHYQEIDPDEMAQAVRIYHLTSGVFAAGLLFGIGNHGGGPQPDMFDRIQELREQTVYPQVHLGGMHDYMDHLQAHETEALARLPVMRDELFLEYHHKTFTVQVRTKAANRAMERGLYHAEALGVMAGLDTNPMLRRAWEITLFNQFHDVLPGTSFPSVYQDVFDDYTEAGRILESTRAEALHRLLGEGAEQYVINTLPWRRPVAIELDATAVEESAILRDDSGNAAPLQKTAEGDRLVAVLSETPAFGVRRIEAVAAPVASGAGTWACGDTWAENRFFRAEFDPEKGYLRSLRMADGAELCAGGIGRLDLLEDASVGLYQNWNMNLTGREDPARCDGFERVEAGPVRARFRAKLSFGRWEKKKEYMVPILWNTPGVDYPTSFFTVDFLVYRDLPYIECVMHADWWEDDTVLKVAADTPLKNTRAFYAIPFGQIERPTKRETAYEKARYEVPALSWADLTDGEHGIAILNTSHHGHDALGGRLRLTLLTSPYGGEKLHVPDPLADRGRHQIRYAFYPHAGGPEAAAVARVAMEYEYQALVATGGVPSVPLGEDLMAVDPERFLVTAVKPAEEGGGFVVRGYEPKGRDAGLELGGPLAAGEMRAVNSLERDEGPAPGALKPHQLVSLRIKRSW